jgi:hypothetical protein
VLPINLPYPDSLLMQVLPEQTWENLTLLRTKLDSTTLDRGVLVPHPRDDYTLLEERLLESLDLRVPRILKCGHFHQPPSPSVASADGSAPPSPTCGNKENGKICPDCDRHIKVSQPLASGVRHTKWEIRVFASNGLMRAGAWVAAWQDMERVDVEILPWIPTELKQELEARRVEIEARELEAARAAQHQEELARQAKELEEESEDSLHDPFGTPGLHSREPTPAPYVSPLRPNPRNHGPRDDSVFAHAEFHLMQATDYLARQDPKTIAIAILSLLVIILALTSSSGPPKAEILPAPVSSPSHSVETSCAMISTQTTIPTPVNRIAIAAENLDLTVKKQEVQQIEEDDESDPGIDDADLESLGQGYMDYIIDEEL